MKTYSHLAEKKRMPSEYEVVTSRLLYYPGRGFEVETPLSAWYAEHQAGSAFVCSDWERFADPRETTYASYTSLEREREAFVDGLFAWIEATDHDRALAPCWLDVLSDVFAVLRYPFHGLSMAAAYVAQMAPSGRITTAALFQAADEVRRIQRIAYRIAMLREVRPRLGADSRERWEQASLFQPLRRAVERLLVTYDWGAAFAGLNLCLKPLVDELTMRQLAERGCQEGDHALSALTSSLHADCLWHRAWTCALVRTAIDDTPSNRDVLRSWVAEAYPRALEAVRAFEPVVGAEACAAAVTAHQAFLAEVGLEPIQGW